MNRWGTPLFWAGLLLALVVLYLFTGSPPPPPDGRTAITVWHPWGGDDGEEFRRLTNEFNKSQDRIFVRALFVPNNLSSNQKLFLSISAGVPPDATFVDGPQVCEWAARGALEPLDDLMAEYGIRAEDFWEPCYRQCQFADKNYAVTFTADPNFGFVWRRDLFEKQGLDPNRPPHTMTEFDEYMRKLTLNDEKGRIRQMGFVPWGVFGLANSLFTWGWAFGGEFYDPVTQRVTCGEDPYILEAVQWMLRFADEYGFERVNAFNEGFGEKSSNPFVRGGLVMAPAHVGHIRLFKKYSPELDYGITAFPYPERLGSDQSAWMGGWSIGLPRGSKHPREAFEFIRWLCTSAEAGRAMLLTMGTFPGYKNSPGFELAKADPKRAAFYEILKNTKHQRPVMPAQAFYMGQLERAMSLILNRERTPEQALGEAQHATQRELDRILKRTASE